MQKKSFSKYLALSTRTRCSIPPPRFGFPKRQLNTFNIEENFGLQNRGKLLKDKELDRLLRERFFYTPAFEIYRGTRITEAKGLYDYGPPGVALQRNIVDLWRSHFVEEDSMLEVDCAMITPHEVLNTSGHVEKFSDWMCFDVKTGAPYRTDHLIRDELEARLKFQKMILLEGTRVLYKEGEYEQNGKRRALSDNEVKDYTKTLSELDGYDVDTLAELITRYAIKSSQGNELSPPRSFNLMFSTGLGPAGTSKGYLRPETAQGQFVDFQRLAFHNLYRMPFASACVGKAFRNEISPQSGILRAREFLVAEIEHFMDPESPKHHPRFGEIADVKLPVLTSDAQLQGHNETKQISIRDCITSNIISHETLGYFLARSLLFIHSLGIDPTRIRLRQHQPSELAHYASDCWDFEVYISTGWIECIGIADRAAYDLNAHSRRTGASLHMTEALPSPVEITEWVAQPDHASIGRTFRKESEDILLTLKQLPQSTLSTLASTLSTKSPIILHTHAGNRVTLTPAELQITKRTTTRRTRTYTPTVVEPSFGLSRLMHCALEHSFYARRRRSGDIEPPYRPVLALPPRLAPVHVAIYPVSGAAEFLAQANALLDTVARRVRKARLTAKIDRANWNLGRRYMRADSIGTPLGLVVDQRTFEDGTVTLRERDSRRQVRGSVDAVLDVARRFVDGDVEWCEVEGELDVVYVPEEKEEEDVEEGEEDGEEKEV